MYNVETRLKTAEKFQSMKEKNKKIENQMISKLTSRQLLWITKKTKHYKLYDLVAQNKVLKT